MNSTRSRASASRGPSGADNTGFPANNLALADLEGVDLVGLLNPDTVVDPHWLERSADALLADDRIGAVTPTIAFADRFAELAVRFDPADAAATLLSVAGTQRPDLVHVVGPHTRNEMLGPPLTLRSGGGA